MKHNIKWGGIFTTSLVAAVLLLAANLWAQEHPTGQKLSSASKETASQYLIISPHTSDQCLKALDETLAMGSKALDKWDYGCMADDHTGYTIVEAKSESEALNLVPATLRSSARVIKLNKFTAEQVKSFHKKS